MTTSRAESPSRGRMTITLHSAHTNEPDETAKVRIEVNNPELVAERVVTQLARKFPPESVVTISTGAVTTDDETEESAQLSPQFYLVTDELDMAVPLEEGQTSVRLFDRSTVSVSPGDVFTVFHDETGHAVGSARGFCRTPYDLEPLPQKRGIATFLQDWVISDELERAVPIAPGQTEVRLADGSAVPVDPVDVHTVAYGSKGLAVFTRSPSGAVAPGVPRKPGIAHAAVPHRGGARPISTSEAVLPPAPKNVHVVLFDQHGRPVGTRTPAGGLEPHGLTHPGSAARAEFYWVAHTPTKIQTMTDHKATLVNGETVQAFPDDIALFLRTHKGSPIGAYVNGRRPSFVTGTLTDIFPELKTKIDSKADRFDSKVDRFDSKADRFDSKVDRYDSKVDRYDSKNGIYDDPYDSSKLDHYDSSPKADRYDPKPDRYEVKVNGKYTKKSDRFDKSDKFDRSDKFDKSDRYDDTDDRYDETSEPYDTPSEIFEAETDSKLRRRNKKPWMDDEAQKVLRRNPRVENYCRSQTYFIPDDINYAIPILADQGHVKLSNGERLTVTERNCVKVDYDFRGFPIQTHFADGRKTPWTVNRPGLGAKFQDYLVHSDLVFAVPITPGQTQVVLSDGSSVPVPQSHVITVFYDHAGKPVFTLAKRKIRPGLLAKPGVAATVQYLNLRDTNDGTGEQFVIPFRASQTEVRDPTDPTRHIPVDRKAIVVAFFDKNRQPLYSQLVDGSLVGGGLLGSRQLDEDDTVSTTSDPTYEFKLPYSEHARRVSLAQMSSSNYRPKSATTKSIPEVYRRTKQQSGLLSRVDSLSPTDDVSTRSRRQEIIERRVPVQQIEYIEKIVEVPEVHIVDKHVEVEQIEWQTKFVKKREIIERPVEHVKYVPKIETKVVERVIEVPQIIEVPRPEIIEQKVKVDRFVDIKKNAAVGQKINPVIRGDATDFFEEVECLTLEPELIPVDVFVPRLVKSRLVAIGVTGETHKEVEVPLAHYNSLVLKMNPMYANNYEKLPMIKTTSGCFPLLPADQQVTVLAPTADEILRVLKAAGVVSRQATPAEVRSLKAAKRKVVRADPDFAPRTSIIH